MAKLLASSSGELTLPKLLADVVGASAVDSASANVGGGLAFDIKWIVEFAPANQKV